MNPDKIKQVLVVRKDLNMRKGKLCAQAAHASLAVFFNRKVPFLVGLFGLLLVPLNSKMRAWVRGSFTKIVVSVVWEVGSGLANFPTANRF